MQTPKLSTGADATLGNYRDLCAAVFGEDSAATRFLDVKIEAAPHGRDEPVIADEGQIVGLLGRIHLGANDGNESA